MLQMTHLLLKRSNGAERASIASPHVDFLSISNELQQEDSMLSGARRSPDGKAL